MLEGRALGDLEDDAVGHRAERGPPIVEIIVEKITGGEVHEDARLRHPVHGFGHDGADPPADREQLAQSLGGIEERARRGQAGLAAPHQRFMGVDLAVWPVDDRLVCHPQAAERAREAGLQLGVIATPRTRVAAARVGAVSQSFALQPSQRPEVGGPANRGELCLRVDRLDEVAEGAVLDRLDGSIDRWVDGDEQNGHVELALADHAQELDPGHDRHVDVRQNDVVLAVREQPFGCGRLRRHSMSKPERFKDLSEDASQ